MKNNVLIWSLILTTLAATAHFFALEYFLYWRLYWFDTVVHFLAGAGVGFFVYWLGQEILSKIKGSFSIYFKHLIYLVLALIVIIGWEIFEYSFHISDSRGYYFVATGKDVLSGLVGCLSALYFLKD
ncbi:MAG: hypothetical protein WAV11_00775 [Minisyncoccia bacterium]